MSFLLVHSPLVGPLTWRSVAMDLRDQGYGVIVPSLAGVWAAGPPYYPRLAERVLAEASADTRTVALHSGAGALAPYLAAARPRTRVIFVDALLPHPGRTWFDTAPADLCEHLTALAVDGWLPPWDRWFPAEVIQQALADDGLRGRFAAQLDRIPLGYFREVAPSAEFVATCGYLRLSAAYDALAEEAGARGWPVLRVDLDHLAVLTRPAEVAELLVTLSAQLG